MIAAVAIVPSFDFLGGPALCVSISSKVRNHPKTDRECNGDLH